MSFIKSLYPKIKINEYIIIKQYSGELPSLDSDEVILSVNNQGNLTISNSGTTGTTISSIDGHAIYDNGSLMTQQPNLNFVGFTVTNSTDTTTITALNPFTYLDESVSGLTMKGDLLMDSGSTYNIGSSTSPVNAIYADELFLSAQSLYVNGKKIISDDSNTINITTDVDQDLAVKTTGLGNTNIISDNDITTKITNTYSSKDINFLNESASGNIIFTTSNGSNIFNNEILMNSGNLYINDSNTHISKDGSNNIVFTDVNSGSKTLADLLTETVTSVNTQTGDVVLDTSHISENTNLYYTEARVSANSSVAANTAKISYPGSASAAELNILDGAIITTTELNYLSGVTSSIQLQLNDRLTDEITSNIFIGDSISTTIGNTGSINIQNSGLSQIRIETDVSPNTKWTLGTGCSQANELNNFFIHRLGYTTTFEISSGNGVYFEEQLLATQAWSTFSNIGGNPSDAITAGISLSWSGDTLNVDVDLINAKHDYFVDKIPVPLNNISYPYDGGNMEGYASQVNDNQSLYFGKSTFRYVRPSDGYTQELSFANKTALVSWVNNNLSNNGSAFTESGYFEVFDKFDDDIPQLENVNGTNTLFHSIKSSSYKAKRKAMVTGVWVGGRTFLASVFNTIHGTSFTATTLNTSGQAEVVWFPGHYYNYNKPLHYLSNNYTTNITKIGYNSTRKCYNTTSTSFETVSSATDEDWEVMKHYGVTYDGTTFRYYDLSINSAKNNYKGDVLRGYEYCIVYGLQSKTNTNKKSIFVKPVGINSIIIDYIDFSKYELEVMANNGHGLGKYNIIKLITSAPYSQDLGGWRTKLLFNDLLPVMKKSYTTFNDSIEIFLRLRDKTTKKVGKLSSFKIILKENRKTESTFYVGFDIKNEKY